MFSRTYFGLFFTPGYFGATEAAQEVVPTIWRRMANARIGGRRRG